MEQGRVRKLLAGSAGAVMALALVACGPASSSAEWARISSLTCRSTIARAHLNNPTEAQLAPERFLEERRRLLDSHRAFNTVSAFRTVCSRVRQELLAEGGAPAKPDSATEDTLS